MAELELWSATRHNMMLRCGEQFRRRYIEGEFQPPGIAMIGGRATHAGVQVNLTHKMRTGDLMPVDEVLDATSDSLRAELTGEWILGGQYEGMSTAQAKRHVSRHVVDLGRLHAEKVAPRINPTHVEARIEVPANDVLPVKFVSVLDVVDGGTRVRDLKTKGKSPRAFEAHQSEQLSGQAIAFGALSGRMPEALQLDVLVRTPRGSVTFIPMPTTRTDQDLDVFVHRAASAIDSVKRGSFKPAPEGAWWCSTKWCGFAETCKYYRRGSNRPQG